MVATKSAFPRQPYFLNTDDLVFLVSTALKQWMRWDSSGEDSSSAWRVSALSPDTIVFGTGWTGTAYFLACAAGLDEETFSCKPDTRASESVLPRQGLAAAQQALA